jgi:hypothetical protein
VLAAEALPLLEPESPALDVEPFVVPPDAAVFVAPEESLALLAVFEPEPESVL